MKQQMMEELVDQILTELPEISGHTLKLGWEISENGTVSLFDCAESSSPLFSGENARVLRNEYNAYVAEHYPEWIPF